MLSRRRISAGIKNEAKNAHQRTGASSSANSRNLGGMPPGPEALIVFKERSAWQTLREETIMEAILVRDRVGGFGALELLREKLAEK